MILRVRPQFPFLGKKYNVGLWNWRFWGSPVLFSGEGEPWSNWGSSSGITFVVLSWQRLKSLPWGAQGQAQMWLSRIESQGMGWRREALYQLGSGTVHGVLGVTARPNWKPDIKNWPRGLVALPDTKKKLCRDEIAPLAVTPVLAFSSFLVSFWII